MIGLTVRHYLAIGIVFTTALNVFGYDNAIAQTIEQTKEVASLPANDWSFWPTDDDKAPDRTVSGASRGNCSSEQVTALLPGSQYGLTSKSYPEVLVATSADIPSQALFSIQSTDGYYYETYIDLPEKPGIVSLTLPSEAPPLVADELYQWSLILMCNNRLRPDSPSLQGWIQIQSTESMTANLTLEQAVEYREAHLWYDMISLLADLRTQYPENSDIHEAWQSILETTDLAAVVNEPILE
ncbi:MAG: DUF928 domain-containing protein [Leptolyngbya sp. SIO3F4]|nr:DUF928 domain-containing protein [Leptolyngbya sp. SIO3F4]